MLQAAFIAQSPSCASTDTPCDQVSCYCMRLQVSSMHGFQLSKDVVIGWMMKSSYVARYNYSNGHLAALDRRKRPLIVLNCLAKLGATGALGSFK